MERSVLMWCRDTQQPFGLGMDSTPDVWEEVGFEGVITRCPYGHEHPIEKPLTWLEGDEPPRLPGVANVS